MSRNAAHRIDAMFIKWAASGDYFCGLTWKMTGSVKVRPPSATRGGGGGTGSARCSMASAASSKDASPDPFTIRLDNTCPIRSRTKLTTTCASCVTRSDG